MKASHCYILTILAALLWSGCLPLSALESSREAFTVVLDAGHGGKDPGAIGRRYKEKNINLSVVIAVGGKIKKRFPEVNVIYTRKTDVFIPLQTRAAIANKAKADLFISIHANSSKSSQAVGCETFTLGSGSTAEAKALAMYENEVILKEENFEEIYQGFDPRSSESYIIFDLIRGHDMEKGIHCAEAVQKQMASSSRLKNRGVFQAGFLVLAQTLMPSILIELGFISNNTEAEFMNSSSGQEKLSEGIVKGFADYYNHYTKVNSSSKERKAREKELSQQEAIDSANEGERGDNVVIPSQRETMERGVEPLFKVQILISPTPLKKNDRQLKGVQADYYREDGMYKYTYGSSSDYNKVVQMRKQILPKFKEAFIVAFDGEKKMNVQKAIQQFKKNRR